MLVLYLDHTAKIGGAEHSLLTLLRAQRDYDAVVACPTGPLADEVIAASVRHRPIRGTSASLRLRPGATARFGAEAVATSIALARMVRAIRADVVHANSIRSGIYAALARRLHDAMTITHVRDVLPDGRASRAVGRLVAHGSDCVIANSAYTRERFVELSGRSDVLDLPNPVDLERFDPAIVDRAAVRQALGIPDATALLVHVAQITPWKAQDTSIRALASLCRQGREAHLAIIGETKFVDTNTRFDNRAYRQSLDELIEAEGLQEHVSFLGERSDVPDLMSAADVVLLPSTEEPFGRAVVEAMAMARPVVATAIGGPPEIIRDGVDGRLAPPGDVRAWADVIASLLDDDRLRSRLGSEARARARDAYGVPANVAALSALYHSPRTGAVP